MLGAESLTFSFLFSSDSAENFTCLRLVISCASSTLCGFSDLTRSTRILRRLDLSICLRLRSHSVGLLHLCHLGSALSLLRGRNSHSWLGASLSHSLSKHLHSWNLLLAARSTDSPLVGSLIRNLARRAHLRGRLLLLLIRLLLTL